MKIKIDDIQTPCSVCLNHFEHEFDGDSSACQSCDYNIAVQLLKRVVRENDWCLYCRNKTYEYGELQCKLGDEMMDGRCREKGYMDLDYKELVEGYGIEVSSD